MTKTRKIRRPSFWNRLVSANRRKKLLAALAVSLVAAAALVVLPVMTYASMSDEIADRDRLMNRNNTGIVLLDRHGEPFFNYGNFNHQNEVKLDDMSDQIKQALIASEDKYFYDHPGFSVRGIASATYSNLRGGDLTQYGGSTITQQLVKNTLLTSDKSFVRKYQEVALAVAVDQHYTKDEILEMYLNSVYFGEGAFGIANAAERYYGKEPADLNLAESSMLVGLLPGPSRFSPISGDFDDAKTRQAIVLDRMIDAGFITEADKEAALEEPLALQTATEPNNRHGQHFAMMVIQEIIQEYGEETAIRSGFQVTTTLDLEWQKYAEQQVKARVDELRAQGGTNAALVAIDPKNGEVRALVGSADWNNPNNGKVNMATSPRQPGSSFKPIHYAEALDKRLITAATVLTDEEKSYGNDTYKPVNYNRRYRGDITVRNALAQSLNIPAVDVVEELGVQQTVTAAQRMGLDEVNQPDRYGLALALGTAEVPLLDMTNAYAAFANGGNQYETATITAIRDKFDAQVYTRRKTAEQVISPEAAFLISSILADNQARAPMFGSRLNIPGRQVAVKTGTTNDNKDAWTIGYTPSLVVGVWLGDNRNRPMSNIAGASGSGPIWNSSLQHFLGDQPAEPFTPPTGLRRGTTCNIVNDRAVGNYQEYYLPGTNLPERCEERNRRLNPPEKREEPEDEEEEPEERERAEERRRERERERNKDKDQRPPVGGSGGGGPGDQPDNPPDEPPDGPPTDDEPDDPDDGPPGGGNGNGNQGRLRGGET